MNMNINTNTRVSTHTRPADMVHIVSFHPSVVSGCSKSVAERTGKIELHQLRYRPLMVQSRSLAGQNAQHPSVLFFRGRVRQVVDWWLETSGSLLQALWAMLLRKARVLCLRRWLQAQAYWSGGKKPCNIEVCWQCQDHPFFLILVPKAARLPWEEENVVVPIPTCAFPHTPVSLAVFAVSVMVSQWSCEWKFGRTILQLSVFPEAAQNFIN